MLRKAYTPVIVLPRLVRGCQCRPLATHCTLYVKMVLRIHFLFWLCWFPKALPTRFNRALLMNIGYAEASKQANYSCYIFHDVDLLPEDDRNLYSCPEHARHMSAAVDKFHYR